MSYVAMDHADWVQRQIAAIKPRTNGRGGGWHQAPDILSEFQAKVFDILGMTFGGIYNARVSWNAVDWHCGSGIGVPMRSQTLATFDFNEMTSLVFLCHEARIRCSVECHGVRGIMLQFHARTASGDVSRRHPNLDEAVTRFREIMPSDHRIIYRKPDAVVQPSEATA